MSTFDKQIKRQMSTVNTQLKELLKNMSTENRQLVNVDVEPIYEIPFHAKVDIHKENDESTLNVEVEKNITKSSTNLRDQKIDMSTLNTNVEEHVSSVNTRPKKILKDKHPNILTNATLSTSNGQNERNLRTYSRQLTDILDKMNECILNLNDGPTKLVPFDRTPSDAVSQGMADNKDTIIKEY